MQLDEMVDAAVPFLLSCVAGVVWTLVAFALFARLLPDFWAEVRATNITRSIAHAPTNVVHKISRVLFP